MHSFFVEALTEDRARLSPEDARHLLKSLRARPGEVVALALAGRRYEAALEMEGGEVYGRVLRELPGSEPKLKITLYQGLPKGDKMDLIVQKAAEIGVSAVVPCLLSRCVGRWEGGDKKLPRWRRIAREAAIQAGRAMIPEVRDALSFEALCDALRHHAQALVPWELGGVGLSSAWGGAHDMALVIGPEGGISAEEIARLAATPVTLGPRILRTETAGLAAASVLLSLSGDMG